MSSWNEVSQIFHAHPYYSDFLKVKERLQQNQFVCWLAGGAVRDFLLGHVQVYDFDLVTDAHTENLKKIFPEAILVGEQFGVLKIPIAPGVVFDLATFREESDYQDGRRPSQVAASTPPLDAERRDFTLNALFWDDENKTVWDYVGGVADLKIGRLKCVGRPEIRFAEDYLRLIRLVRFQAQLRLPIDSLTENVAKSMLSQIDHVSGERIWLELKKISHANDWSTVLQRPLFQQLIEQIFGCRLQYVSELASVLGNESWSVSVDLGGAGRDWFQSSDQIKNWVETLALLIILSSLDQNELQTEKILKEKLHVSKEERADFNLLIELKKHLKFSFVQAAVSPLAASEFYELCYWVDKNKKAFFVFQMFSELVPSLQQIFLDVKKVLQNHSQILIDGAYLSQWLAPSEIKHALKWARLMQFQDLIQTEKQAHELVLKQFQNKS